jgi:DNA-binding FadR family transcriptional regulator
LRGTIEPPETNKLRLINEGNSRNVDDPSEFLKGYLRLHQKLYEINGNPLLKILFESFVTWEIYQRETTGSSALEVTHNQHVAIVDEIANHAPDRAYSMMSAHLY